MKTTRFVCERFFLKPSIPGLLLFAFVAAMLLTSPDASAAKSKKNKKPIAAAQSHNFFAFADANYFTSPDQRIGAKLIVDSARVGPTLSSLQHLTFLPTASVKPHRHVYVTEIVYILKGSLTIRIGQETKVMGPDTAAYIPPQTFHEYLNSGTDVCQVLQFYSPSGPEEEYRNWEKPGEKQAASATAATSKKQEEKNVVRGPLPPIPGSPFPRLQRVDEEALEPAPSASQTASTAGSPTAKHKSVVTIQAEGGSNNGTATLDLKFKTRFDQVKPGNLGGRQIGK